MISPMHQFRYAIRAAGLIPPDVIEPDGILHRFSSNGERCDDAGWYVFFNDGMPAGIFGDWRKSISRTWRADVDRPLTRAEENEYRIRVAAMQRQREDEKTRRWREAQKDADQIWSKALPSGGHPYLSRKQVTAHGTRRYKNELVIPLRIDDVLHSLQFISVNGDKRFLTGGQVKGCYFMIGNAAGADVLGIAEGFSTGASIHQATDYPVAIAFNATNVAPVAKAMREQFPDAHLILCADDDYATPENPGLTTANAAAMVVGGVVAVPDFGPDRPDGATDFNDMATHCGNEAVREIMMNAAVLVSSEGQRKKDKIGNDSAGGNHESIASSETEVSGVSGVQASKSAHLTFTPAASTEVARVSKVSDEPGRSGASNAQETPDLVPNAANRPAFRVFDEQLECDKLKFKPGVWYFDIEKDGILTHTRVCSPLHVAAVTSDGQHQNFGRLLRFKNTLGHWREWAMPMEMLRGAGDDLRGELLAMGVEIEPSMRARRLLSTYLQSEPPKRQMRCALQVGWFEDSFILPDSVIGPKSYEVIFQSGAGGHDEHTKAGTLVGWQEEISSRAVGNPLLLLALSAAFAGPMLALCNAEGGGLHFVGDSSTGKTTLLEAACSVWGGPNYRRSWRATANGMEGAAALFNDCLLALDEISECNPHEVDAIIYALSNGRGKQRAGRGGSARALTRWRCSILSSGERSIETTMQEAGHRAKAGQKVRLLDVSAARAYGAWNELHGLSSGTAFSDAIKQAAVTHYGHAGRAFLEKLTHDNRDFCAYFERFKGLKAFALKEGAGQEKRTAGRFALLALAGELATEYGITGWTEGDATKAAAQAFRAWLAGRGTGNDETTQILAQVSAFIERHGDSRFSNVREDREIPVRERAGWWEDSGGSRTYLFTADGMREVLKGFDYKRGLDALQEAGALPSQAADGKHARPRRIDKRSVRVYAIQSDKLGGGHGA